jgi:hypothetical protein
MLYDAIQSLLNLVCLARSNLMMKSKSISSALATAHRFIAPGFRDRLSTIAAAPSINSNSTSVVVAAY